MDNQMKSMSCKVRTGLRQTEGALDDALLESTNLMQTMLRARQNPVVTPHTGQRSVVRLVRAMQRQVEAATDIFRIHDEMSQIGIAYGVLDRNDSTPPAGFEDNETNFANQPDAVA